MRTRFLLFPSALLLGLHSALAQTAKIAAAAPAPAPSASLGGSFVQMLFGLALVLGLLFAGVWLLKKLTGASKLNQNLLHVVGATPIGARERIVIVELGQTWLVLGVTPNSINTLAEMPRQALPPGTRPVPPNFADWLRNTMNGRNAR
ncbi:MAG TPA: flagellar biosynthetic protein FliO [Rhodocyclaceae bacterium]|nr:flagellar biosynthetic protein FliO [Rhodocyclaceae bacterium]